MAWEIAALIAGAAVGGRAAGAIAGKIAQRFGRSREAAENAIATGGISLLVEDDQREQPGPDRTPVEVH